MIPILFEPKETNFDSYGIGAMNDCKSCIVTEEENGQYEAALTFPITTKYTEYLEDFNYQLKIKPNDEDDYNIFVVYNHYKDMATGLLYVSGRSRSFKLGNRTVKKVTIENKTGREAMQMLHDAMDLESDVQMTCDITNRGSTSFEVENPLTCIKGTSGSLLQTYGGEIKHEPFKLSLLSRRGRDDVTTIRYRKNLNGLKVELDWSGLVTRIFPYADVQNDQGETERIYGTGVDSQYIKNYDGEVYARHIQFTEDQGATDLNSLNKVAAKYFTSMNPGVDKPRVNISVDILKLDTSEKAKKFKGFRRLNLCDTFSIYHERFKINLSAKVIAVEYDSLAEKVVKLTAGDAKYTFFEEQKNELTEVFKKVPTKSYASVFIDYVTEIISGNDGGHVIWWPKNRPTDLFFCDNPNLEAAKQVLRINKSGIGFSSSGWKGPFTTAWTLDGTFVADFIKAGTLRAIDIIGVNITGSTIKGTDIFGSTFETVNPNGTKIKVENGTVRFLSADDKQLATINLVTNGGNPLLHFQFNNGGTAETFHINKDSIMLKHSKKIQLIAPEIELDGNVNVTQDLKIKDELVYPGQHGGGSGKWDGTYPAGFTSQADQFLWQWWVYFIELGFSPAAAAGILGNIRGEAGPSFNPDTEQIGGPAYGGVQFDGSAYPLVGPPTYNGRQYVQNLMAAAGITEDYTGTRAQSKLIDWACYNGQWQGKVQPTSITGFKSINDPRTAAYAFEENFERPLNSHPERQGWAEEIYNRLKDIPISYTPTGGGTRAKFVELCVAQQGKPYVWGGEGPDVFDCSGLVMWALKQLGISYPHYTGDQWNKVQRINESELRAGDLIFYGPNASRHVSVYISPGVCFEAKSPADGIGYGNYRAASDICGYGRITELTDGQGGVGADGLNHLKTLLGRGIGNGQCYAASAEYSGFLGGCGLGAGTKYGLSHVIGNTSAASDIGVAYNWAAVGWKVILNPNYDQLVVGAIINWARGGRVGTWFADPTYGHTGIIRGLSNGRMQTYEQNTEHGQVIAELDREYYGASHISSIVIPPK